MNRPDRTLYGPSRQPLEVIGRFEGELRHKGRKTNQSIFVVKELQTNLLGLPSIIALNLAVRVDAITKAKADIKAEIVEKFPSVFEGLGNLGEDYEIKLNTDAKPYAIFTPGTYPYCFVQRSNKSYRRWRHWE